ncbi:Toll-like receptor 6 [Gryllus bimaculatus]|nr:Toll-like receptor 6 [Gryllus bimaculatus]
MQSLNITFYWLLFSLFFVGTQQILLTSKCSCYDRTTDCSFRQMLAIQGRDLCSQSSTWKFRGNNLRTLPQIRLSGKLDLSKNEFGLNKRFWINTEPLSELDASDNYFSDLSFAKPIWDCSLNVLNVSNNGISKLDKTLDRCRNIRVFRIANNKLSHLNDDSFSKQELLQFLDLAGNPLKSISPKTFSAQKSLLTLDLSNTHLSDLPVDIFSELTLLQHLHLSGSNFTKLPTSVFSSLKSLVTLYLQRNTIRELQPGIFDTLFQLKVLNLDSNQLQHLPPTLFHRLHSLEHLSARSNHLRALPSLRLCSAPLRIALFSDNAITAVDEDDLRALWRPGFQLADITNNPVESCSFKWANSSPDINVFTEGSLVKIGMDVMDRGIVWIQN